MSPVDDRLTTRRQNVARLLAEHQLDSAEEFGAWWRIDQHIFLAGVVSDDPARLARLAGVTPQRWPTVWAAIAARFVAGPEAGTLVSAAAVEARAEALGLMAARRAAGARGGRPTKSARRTGPTPVVGGDTPPPTTEELDSLRHLMLDIFDQRVQNSRRVRRPPTDAEVGAVLRAAHGRPVSAACDELARAARAGEFAAAEGYGLLAHHLRRWASTAA